MQAALVIFQPMVIWIRVLTLRTALVKNNKIYVQAGAGIVADSVPTKEYQETINKAKALLEASNENSTN